MLRLLGRGGMAEVYLAAAVGEPPVVIKRILGAARRDTQDVQLFQREARIGQRLRHPNIVTVYELIEDDGELALVMEYLEGLSLGQLGVRAWTGGRSLPIEPLVMMMADAARALDYAHGFGTTSGGNAGVVHRDVSPDNLVLTQTGKTKLIDFGVAKPGWGDDLTNTRLIRGKPTYMSPEQIEGRPLDGRSDLWSLGVSFYWLFTGVRPFRRGSLMETMRAVLEEEPRPIHSLNPRVPLALSLIVSATMRKDKALRTPTGKELAEQLEALMARVPAGHATPARLLDTVRSLEGEQHALPPHAALPSVDWQDGTRRPSVGYDQTAPMPLSPAGLSHLATAVIPIVGTLDAGDDDYDDLIPDDTDNESRRLLAARLSEEPTRVTRPRPESPTALAPAGASRMVTDTGPALPAPHALETRTVEKPAAVELSTTSGELRPAARDLREPKTETGISPMRASAYGSGRSAAAVTTALFLLVVGIATAWWAALPDGDLERSEETPLPAVVASKPAEPALPDPSPAPPPDEVRTESPAEHSDDPRSEAGRDDDDNNDDDGVKRDRKTRTRATRQRARRAASATRHSEQRKVQLSAPAGIEWWTPSGEALGRGSREVTLPVQLTSLRALDPARGGRTNVPIRGGQADFSALPTTTLLVQARPWATVWLGQQELGVTPLVIKGMKPGRYRVQLRFEEEERTETVLIDDATRPVVLRVDMRE